MMRRPWCLPFLTVEIFPQAIKQWGQAKETTSQCSIRLSALISSQPSSSRGNFTSDANGNLLSVAIRTPFRFKYFSHLGDQIPLYLALNHRPYFQIIGRSWLQLIVAASGIALPAMALMYAFCLSRDERLTVRKILRPVLPSQFQ
jgi:hypothetical protein